MTGCIVRFSPFSLVTLLVALQLFSSFIPGCQDLIHLKHFGKREILKKINLMEPEFDQPMTFDESRALDQPAGAGAEIGSWGYRVQVYGVARGHRRKKETPSLLTDMCWILLRGGDAGCEAVSADTWWLPDWAGKCQVAGCIVSLCLKVLVALLVAEVASDWSLW